MKAMHHNPNINPMTITLNLTNCFQINTENMLLILYNGNNFRIVLIS